MKGDEAREQAREREGAWEVSEGLEIFSALDFFLSTLFLLAALRFPCFLCSAAAKRESSVVSSHRHAPRPRIVLSLCGGSRPRGAVWASGVAENNEHFADDDFDIFGGFLLFLSSQSVAILPLGVDGRMLTLGRRVDGGPRWRVCSRGDHHRRATKQQRSLDSSFFFASLRLRFPVPELALAAAATVDGRAQEKGKREKRTMENDSGEELKT